MVTVRLGAEVEDGVGHLSAHCQDLCVKLRWVLSKPFDEDLHGPRAMQVH